MSTAAVLGKAPQPPKQTCCFRDVWLERVLQQPGNAVLYYLTSGSRTANIVSEDPSVALGQVVLSSMPNEALDLPIICGFLS